MDINTSLISFLDQSHTCYQATQNVRQILVENGYEEILESSAFTLQKGGKYFVVRNESSIIAFRIPMKDPVGFMIGASHSDSPTFKVKTNPEIIEGGYVKLNVEGYGGMLMSPWLDRPLSVAGRVVVKSETGMKTMLVDVDEDWMMIPNLAIHMDRESNTNHTWNAQKDMCPIIGSSEHAKGTFMKKVAESVGVDETDIIGHDLYLYVSDHGRIWGSEKEYLSAGRLDDLQCGFANLHGFLQSEESKSIPVLAIFDNEEVGSRTKQGADSTFLEDILRRITYSSGGNENDYLKMVANSFMVSADNGHALHPNHMEKADPTNRPQMNQGIVIKYNANQAYTTDAVSEAIFKEICRRADVPTQTFTNRSDMRGGSTLGNLSNSHVSLNTVDIGLAQLAMHSNYETCGTKDTEYLIRAMKEFFTTSLIAEERGSYRF